MISLENLNFHHLFYFWVVAQEGSITAASRRLHLAQPSISMQLRKLEQTIDSKLFHRSGRGLVLTVTGKEVYRYAEEIFATGQDLIGYLEGRPQGRRTRLTVGVPDVLPKLITYRLLEPVFQLDDPVEVICHEGKFEQLLADLAINRFDVLLSDSPLSSEVRVRAFNHKLGGCGITIFATNVLAKEYCDGFPASLDGAPFLVPTSGTELRRSLDHWFNRHEIKPLIVGQFDDSALLKEFGLAGLGLFAGPTAIAEQIQFHFQVKVVGSLEGMQENFFAITTQRRIRHPAVIAISEAARTELLAPH